MTDYATDLHEAAFAQFEWATNRIASYQADGATPPDPVVRLHKLAGMVLDTLPRVVVPVDASNVERLRYARGGIDILRGTLDAIARRLDGGDPQPDPPACAASSPPATAATERIAGVAAYGWPASGLRHGLLLRALPFDGPGAEAENAIERNRPEFLISEPVKGSFVAQIVKADGSLEEPYSTLPTKWLPAEWCERAPHPFVSAIPRYDSPKARKPRAAKPSAQDRTVALPGMAEVAPVPTATEPKRSNVATYAPNDAQFATWLGALRKHEPTLEEAAVRACFAAWQAANGGEDKANPAATFWQHARATLTPQVPT